MYSYNVCKLMQYISCMKEIQSVEEGRLNATKSAISQFAALEEAWRNRFIKLVKDMQVCLDLVRAPSTYFCILNRCLVVTLLATCREISHPLFRSFFSNYLAFETHSSIVQFQQASVCVCTSFLYIFLPKGGYCIS